ncbi:hypothetical protein DEA8626_02177 [Defluviimonas aquaemixtae]|uniref:Nitrile hydratase beta subunit-like N-terminal domain-containing protein n=1 Tax=Albidovulum aquaemixtae TaxID=1542388 RepID=A0A2R8B7R2_9RHOB|nr:nitrile hydratase accessory protein [Defluviimonas aquaemixtae]SPH18637.1 hypothetical protein DEA8626_02177 [Defluviimonas aquaemixtae]
MNAASVSPSAVPSCFDEPWQSDLFALTVALNEAGHLIWPDWTAAFGATLAARGRDRPLDGGADYFAAWLETLERVVAERGLADVPDLEGVRAAWERAYRETPHGRPVRL